MDWIVWHHRSKVAELIGFAALFIVDVIVLRLDNEAPDTEREKQKYLKWRFRRRFEWGSLAALGFMVLGTAGSVYSGIRLDEESGTREKHAADANSELSRKLKSLEKTTEPRVFTAAQADLMHLTPENFSEQVTVIVESPDDETNHFAEDIAQQLHARGAARIGRVMAGYPVRAAAGVTIGYTPVTQTTAERLREAFSRAGVQAALFAYEEFVVVVGPKPPASRFP